MTDPIAITLHAVEAARLQAGEMKRQRDANAAEAKLEGPHLRRFFVGDLIENPEGSVYLIVHFGGLLGRRGYLEPDTLNAMHRPNVQRKRVSEGCWPALRDKIKEGDPILSGTHLTRIYGDGAIWLVDGSVARPFANPEAFEQYQFDWEKVRPTSREALMALERDLDHPINTSNVSFEVTC